MFTTKRHVEPSFCVYHNSTPLNMTTTSTENAYTPQICTAASLVPHTAREHEVRRISLHLAADVCCFLFICIQVKSPAKSRCFCLGSRKRCRWHTPRNVSRWTGRTASGASRSWDAGFACRAPGGKIKEKKTCEQTNKQSNNQTSKQTNKHANQWIHKHTINNKQTNRKTDRTSKQTYWRTNT